MKMMAYVLLVIGVWSLVIGQSAYAGNGAVYSISTEVFGGGGGDATSSQYDIHGKIEGAGYGIISGTTYRIGEGFLHASYNAMSLSPLITSVSPNSYTNNGTISVNINGANFFPGATVKLIRFGQPDITGESLTVLSTTNINCTFDLNGVVDGQWSVVVINTDGASYILNNGFTVVTPSQQPKIVGNPSNYPSPFNPDTGGQVTITYKLSTDAPIVFEVYNIRGTRIWQKTYPPGGQGGKAGTNDIFWDGYTVFSALVPNGIYVYRISSGGETLATGKIAVFR